MGVILKELSLLAADGPQLAAPSLSFVIKARISSRGDGWAGQSLGALQVPHVTPALLLLAFVAQGALRGNEGLLDSKSM